MDTPKTDLDKRLLWLEGAAQNAADNEANEDYVMTLALIEIARQLGRLAEAAGRQAKPPRD